MTAVLDRPPISASASTRRTFDVSQQQVRIFRLAERDYGRKHLGEHWAWAVPVWTRDAGAALYGLRTATLDVALSGARTRMDGVRLTALCADRWYTLTEANALYLRWTGHDGRRKLAARDKTPADFHLE